MKKELTLMIIVTLLLIFMVGAWNIDTGVSAKINGGYVQGLGWTRDPLDQYHLGLIIIITTFMASLFLLIKMISFGGRK